MFSGSISAAADGARSVQHTVQDKQQPAQNLGLSVGMFCATAAESKQDLVAFVRAVLFWLPTQIDVLLHSSLSVPPEGFSNRAAAGSSPSTPHSSVPLLAVILDIVIVIITTVILIDIVLGIITITLLTTLTMTALDVITPVTLQISIIQTV